MPLISKSQVVQIDGESATGFQLSQDFMVVLFLTLERCYSFSSVILITVLQLKWTAQRFSIEAKHEKHLSRKRY